MNKVTVIGAGFAGVEAARQLSRAGIRVTLCEMKPQKFSPAHSSPNFAELVCSNSFKALRTASAAGELKAEMEMLGSLCVSCAKATAVPAGGALAVDRDDFSALVTKTVEEDPLIDIVRGEVTEIPADGVVIIAAGPLASDALSNEIEKICPGRLSFYDAAAPIVSAQSLDMSCAFKQSRYDRGGEDDYINCPMNKEEYEAFYEALVGAESAETHSFDKRKGVYEGCMPIEVMALRGQDTIRFGPMKPVGLRDPRTGHRPWAVLQLRKENSAGTMYNLVGFQTNILRGSDNRRGRLYGVRRLGNTRRHQRRAVYKRKRPIRHARGHRHGGARTLYQRRERDGFSAHGRKLRNTSAPRRAYPLEAGAL